MSVLSRLLYVTTNELTLQATKGYSAGHAEKLYQVVVLYSSEVLVTFQDEKELRRILSGLFLLALCDSALVLECLFFLMKVVFSFSTKKLMH